MLKEYNRGNSMDPKKPEDFQRRCTKPTEETLLELVDVIKKLTEVLNEKA